MNVPPKVCFFLLALALLTGWGTRPACADPPAPVTAPLPDYGGRDGGMATLQASPDMNPAGQAVRATEALFVVLALVAGGVYGLKRLGLVGTDGKFRPGTIRLPRQPRRDGTQAITMQTITVQSSQPLPGGGGLHIVSVAGRTLLLGATAQSVTLLSELDTNAPPAFDDVLAREQEHAAPPLSAAADRLQTLLARSRTGS